MCFILSLIRFFSWDSSRRMYISILRKASEPTLFWNSSGIVYYSMFHYYWRIKHTRLCSEAFEEKTSSRLSTHSWIHLNRLTTISLRDATHYVCPNGHQHLHNQAILSFSLLCGRVEVQCIPCCYYWAVWDLTQEWLLCNLNFILGEVGRFCKYTALYSGFLNYLVPICLLLNCTYLTHYCSVQSFQKLAKLRAIRTYSRHTNLQCVRFWTKSRTVLSIFVMDTFHSSSSISLQTYYMARTQIVSLALICYWFDTYVLIWKCSHCLEITLAPECGFPEWTTDIHVDFQIKSMFSQFTFCSALSLFPENIRSTFGWL